MFIVFCYIPWWISAPVASSAPISDLKMISNITQYKAVDSIAANAALKAVGLHMCYLTQELVPLCIFSDLGSDIKSKVAKAILCFWGKKNIQNRKGSGFGKLVFPNIEEDKTDLTDFVRPDCHFFFKILGINEDFLSKLVENWAENEDYVHGKHIVQNLHVVNDAAERGVKLFSDFLGAAKSESRFQDCLQVVENCRNRLPNQRKRKHESQKWWLELNF
ncbi:hypothetical protein Ahia01_000554900 [Argonauta hians]